MTSPASADGMTYAQPPAPGLQRAGARVPVDEYTRRLWNRRWFVAAYSTASNGVGYEGSRLGQAWQVLTPLLHIGVYYLIFGLLLHTNRGVPNFIAFLSVGVFVFSFCTTSLVSGAKAITTNLGLVRALPFPRAVLPLSTTLVAFQQLVYSVIVLVPILLISGEPLSLKWVELVPAVLLQAMFCLGLALAVARLGATLPDTTQILPFFSRIWMYLSGVMFSIPVFIQGHSAAVGWVLTYNPGSVYVQLARGALLAGFSSSPATWLLGFAWGAGTLSTAYLYFWRGEERYGNV